MTEWHSRVARSFCKSCGKERRNGKLLIRRSEIGIELIDQSVDG